MYDYDLLVVGAGHAGCEAAYAASIMGLRTCLITINLESIAQMSCNPAIGGIAKGNLVREIDALGGLMGRIADETGIQFRLLNRSRGGAVQAPRAQCDKAAYRRTMKKWMENTPGLTLYQAIVRDLLVRRGKTCGVRTVDDNEIYAKAVILTPGTFLNGMIHIGLNSYSAGLANKPGAQDLSRSLKKLTFNLYRLKTGTPMRLHRKSIDWKRFQIQSGDPSPVPFSFRTRKKLYNQAECYLGHTNENTHVLIRGGLSQSPLYSGKITGTGTRYCPSIEDKVVKFPHRDRHQFFLEPEGLETEEIYVNGLSSSLPLEIQRAVLDSIPGLEQSVIMRPAYGIEYDAVSPDQLKPTLETRILSNLYLAGQINGTSGYEEAAAQGLIAGINAALKINRRKPFILGREEAYAGVLIDDLISKNIEEPYRLFTSRAEYRLQLRIDNADRRLIKYGTRFGLIGKADHTRYLEKQDRIRRVMAFLTEETLLLPESRERLSLKEWLKKPGFSYDRILSTHTPPLDLTEEETRHIESEIKYEGYIKRQEKEISQLRKTASQKIPADLDFSRVSGLTKEMAEKMTKLQPRTLGEANKTPGITPAALVNLHLHIKLKLNRPSR